MLFYLPGVHIAGAYILYARSTQAPAHGPDLPHLCPVIWLPTGLKMWSWGSGGTTSLLPNFQICGEPCRLDSTALCTVSGTQGGAGPDPGMQGYARVAWGPRASSWYTGPNPGAWGLIQSAGPKV